MSYFLITFVADLLRRGQNAGELRTDLVALVELALIHDIGKPRWPSTSAGRQP
ncbi:MAG TPA: hypothetical protein VH352_13735 [Pseudonocardiaceae bacterium]|nr:hypothetical protein [Pseudonocardiaceae bacterium]